MADIHSLTGKALLMLALILVALNIGGWMKKRNFKYFGETAMCISVGLATSVIFRLFSHVFKEDILNGVQLSTNFFYMVLLPPIIFEGGYSVRRAEFFRNLPLIFGLAFIGGVFSTMVVALVFYLASLLVLENPISIVESLIFGSLISSTDPVTILAMLPPETDKMLYMIIFGESALNDAVAIILYRFFSRLADPSIPLTASQFFMSLVESLFVFLGSFGVGVICAFLFAILTKHAKLTHEADIYEVTMLLVFAYSSYLLAELLHLTGIISVFFCGLAMAHYARPNMSSGSALVAKKLLRVFCTICECFIFMYLGMGLFAFPNARYDVVMIIAALVAIALGRTHVFLVCGLHNAAAVAAAAVNELRVISMGPVISFGKQVFIWFSGLRGAVAFALAVQLLDNEYLEQRTRSLIFGTSIIVIVTTVFGLNLLTPPLIGRLDIKAVTKRIKRRISSREPTATGTSSSSSSAAAAAGTELNTANQEEEDLDEEDEDLYLSGTGGAPSTLFQGAPAGVLGLLYRLDERYLRPLFCLPHGIVEQRASNTGHSIVSGCGGDGSDGGNGGGERKKSSQAAADEGTGYVKLNDGIDLCDLATSGGDLSTFAPTKTVRAQDDKGGNPSNGFPGMPRTAQSTLHDTRAAPTTRYPPREVAEMILQDLSDE